MLVHIAADAPGSCVTSALLIPVFTDQRLDGVACEIDRTMHGALQGVLTSRELSGKANEFAILHAHAAPYRRVVLVGLGERSKFTPNVLARPIATAVRGLEARNIDHVAVMLPGEAHADVIKAVSSIVEGAMTATLDLAPYRSDAEKRTWLRELLIHAGDFDRASIAKGIERGTALGEGINIARQMSLTPANDMTPTDMAHRAREIAAQCGLDFHVLDEAQMAAKMMGLVLSISQGSDQPATMSVITYRGDPSNGDVLALVGKGVTFDSGGTSLKTPEGMARMKYDMCGGAGVFGAMYAIGKLKPKINVMGIVPSSENLPGPRALKPGDVVRAMNGKTVEVITTDAEGRMLLADALCYARELGATRMVDVATLTSANSIAFGGAASGVMSNDDEFVQSFLTTVADVGERYWRLPLYDDYDRAMKSDIADLKNADGRAGDAQKAAAFLKSFVADVPWIHIDIAGTAWTNEERPYLAKGPTGTPVRAFLAFVEALSRQAAGVG